MAARRSAMLTVLVTVVTVLQTSTAHAESPLQLASSIESSAVVPTSSTKELLITLQVLVPLARAAGTRISGGLGPVAMTRHLVTSTLPEVIAFGVAGTIRLAF